MLEKLEEVVEQLAMICDIIVFNCTTESVALVVDYDEETVKRIEAAAKLPGIIKNILGMTSSPLTGVSCGRAWTSSGAGYQFRAMENC